MNSYYQQYQQQYAAYGQHYAAQAQAAQAQARAQAQGQSQSQAQGSGSASTARTGGGGGGGGGEDITNMNDVLGAAGVDLRVSALFSIMSSIKEGEANM